MLGVDALDELRLALTRIATGIAIERLSFGDTPAVEKRAGESVELFKGYSKRVASRNDGCAFALAVVRGQDLDDYQYDLVAGYLNEPLKERDGETLMGSSRLPKLLEVYEAQGKDGTLWRLTWFGLLCSYFSYRLEQKSSTESENWARLRSFLRNSWPLIDRKSDGPLVPDWVKAIRTDPQILSESPAQRYALDYLRGQDEAVRRLSADLAIPNTSWFWHQLVLSAVRESAERSDGDFKSDVPRLLALIREHSGFRDDALEIILTRYQRCRNLEMHVELRDYVVGWNVWRNPKLRAAGQATSWNRVSDDVWRMVLQWVNESNLRDFFQILATRAGTDEGRLEFWSRYINQISWTRLVFGAETRSQVRSNRAIRDLFAREQGAYAEMTGSGVKGDAFMMQIGEYVIVEYSETGAAAYVYASEKLKFDRNARQYEGGTGDLRFGYHDTKRTAVRITHHGGWQESAAQNLKTLGIYPDRPGVRSAPPPAPYVAPAKSGSPKATSTSTIPRFVPESMSSKENTDTQEQSEPSREWRGAKAPLGASFTMEALLHRVRPFPKAYIDDRRTDEAAKSGRLWVVDPNSNQALEKWLKSQGFMWAEKRKAWYYPPD